MTKQPKITPEELVNSICAANGVTLEAVFVPFHVSRHAKPKPNTNDLQLNWRVTLLKNGVGFITEDYSQGIGHAPSYKKSVKEAGGLYSLMRFEMLHHEATTGRCYGFGNKPLPAPTLADVVYSLCSDAYALEAGSFSDWASEYGYSDDSISAKKTYEACLEIGLKLRKGLGNDLLMKLQEAAREM